jgi:predicted ATP-grasp superfamily ATP-dependent carboligase
MRVLVLDSNAGRGCLAAVRGLARGGWTVGVATPARTGLPSLSRFARHRHLLPPVTAGVEPYVQAVCELVARRGYSLVFACSDAEVLALSERRESIPACIPYASHPAVVRAIDKDQLGQAARAVGLLTPPQASSARQAAELWGPGAVIVKESLHGALGADGHVSHVAPELCADAQAAERRVSEIRASGGAAIVQPALEGRLMAFSSVVDRSGAMLARVQQVAERTYPLAAGLSVRARTVAVDMELAGQVQELLRELGWLGLCELQFLQPAKGQPVLLDLNGRFYGSLALALAAGVNLPDLWARCALGLPGGEVRDGRPDVRYQWMEGDLKAARESSRGALADVADCLRYANRAHDSIWSASDPLPGARAAAALVGGSLGALMPKRAVDGSGPSSEGDPQSGAPDE